MITGEQVKAATLAAVEASNRTNEDSKMLDWLNDRYEEGNVAIYYEKDPHEENCAINIGNRGWYGKTFREALQNTYNAR